MISPKIMESFLVLSMTFASIGSMEVPKLSLGHAELGNYPFMDMEKCGYIHPKDSPGGRIIAGTPAKEGEFPWMASIHFKNILDSRVNDTFICGGVLIHTEWVLSGLHCVEGMVSNQLKINLGSVNKYQYHGVHFVSDLVRNPNWDLVLLRLATPAYPVVKSDHYVINTICLPKEKQLNSIDEEALFSGFGFTDTKAKVKSPVLQKTVLIINSYTKCADMTYNLNDICVTESQHMTCMGDSGSPLVQFDGKRAILIGTLTGVKSFVKDVCGAGESHFKRVSFFIDWISFFVDKKQSRNPSDWNSLDNPPPPQLLPANEDLSIQSSTANCISVLILSSISFLSHMLFL